MRYGRKMLVLCFVAGLMAAPGCSSRQSTVLENSNEWRLQNLEASQLEEQAKSQTAGVEVASRMQNLETRIQHMEQLFEKSLVGAAVAQAEAETLRASIDAQENGAMGPGTPVGQLAEDPERSAASAMRAVHMGADEKERYQAGVNAVMNGEVASGRSILQAFQEDFPDSALIPNVHYWLGEALYHEKRYAEAILTFKEVVRNYPTHNKASAAMLKTGYAYALLGDKNNARFYLQALLDKYPGSEPAALARTKLAKL